MRKFFITLLVAITTMSTFAGIKIEEKYDDFTNSRYISTRWEGFQKYGKCHFKVTSTTKATTLGFKIINDRPAVVTSENAMIFLDKDGEKMYIFPLGVCSASIGGGSTGLVGSKYWGVTVNYLLTDENIEWLSTHDVAKVRFQDNEAQDDLTFSDKETTKIKEMICTVMERAKSTPKK